MDYEADEAIASFPETNDGLQAHTQRTDFAVQCLRSVRVLNLSI